MRSVNGDQVLVANNLIPQVGRRFDEVDFVFTEIIYLGSLGRYREITSCHRSEKHSRQCVWLVEEWGINKHCVLKQQMARLVGRRLLEKG